MSYTDEEHNALMEENTPFDGDALHDEYVSSHTNLIKASNMATLENESAFGALKEEMNWGGKIDLEFLLENNCPYYRFFSVSASETMKLHLNREIANYIYKYLESNVLEANIPTDFVGATNAKESYLLHLLKRDRQNDKLSYDPETGYKATYNRISINYGKLPYTLDELAAKLSSL